MPGELEIIVKTTDACNAACVYCSAGSGSAGRRRLSIDTARVLIDQASRLVDDGRFERVRFLWHGGEPLLLGKEFFRQLRAIAHDRPFAHNLQTNLTLLDREWIEILEPLLGRQGLGTSVDPFDDVRRFGARPQALVAPASRRCDDGDSGSTLDRQDGYLARWLEGIDLLDEAGWRAGCVYVLHREGLERARDLYWFFRNVRDNSSLSLRVNPLLRVGRAGGDACDKLALEPGEYGRFLIALAETWLADHRRLVISPIRDIVQAREANATVRSCDLAGRAGCMDAHLGIDAEGNIYNCGRAVDAAGLRFGNLRKTTLGDCLRHTSREVLRSREGELIANHCGDCRFWRFCHGGCPYESHTASERAHQPTQLCPDYQAFFSWMENMIPDGRAVMPESQNESAKRDTAPGDQRADVPRTESYERVDPEAGIESVIGKTAAGRPVLLDRLREWPADALEKLANHFLRAPDLEVPIEPFYSMLLQLTPAGRVRPLPVMYGETPAPQRDPSRPCLTCQAFKFCRGFWLDPRPRVDHCHAWRRIDQAMRTALREMG